jgi:glycyl-tRNA synthetase beta chain
MGAWVENLKNVTFHNKLGTQAELIERMAVLARELAPMVGADLDAAEQAARIAKADLSSEMVYEFPELQGLMGRYYALAAGHSDEVAAAAEEHYAPLGPSDAVPTAPVSVAVALAEKIDKLTGFWAIDEKPTGSKDPFALRRAALGVIRILVENDLSVAVSNYLDASDFAHDRTLNVPEHGDDDTIEEISWILSSSRLVDWAKSDQSLIEEIARLKEELNHGTTFYKHEQSLYEIVAAFNQQWIDELGTNLLSFLHDRLKVYLKDQGIRHDIIDACIAMPQNDDLTLLVKRARALSDTLKTDDGENLLQAFKRANNILTQAETADGVEYSYGADVKFAENDAERAVFAALDTAEAAIKPAMESQDFTTAMSAMAGLRPALDAFFEATQINTDNGAVRRNRLNLLSRIRTLCTSVADLTRIDG